MNLNVIATLSGAVSTFYGAFTNRKARETSLQIQADNTVLQDRQHEQRLLAQVYEGRMNRESQERQNRERLVAQLLEKQQDREIHDRQHKERLLMQIKEGELNRAAQLQIFQWQQALQLEIKALEAKQAQALRETDRRTQLELLKRRHELGHLPVYPGVDAVLSNPLTEGLQKVQLIFSPPTIQHDKAQRENGFPQIEQAMTDALRSFVDAYQQTNRMVRLEGGAWISKVHHGEVATGAIFRELRTEPVILLEASVEGEYYYLKMGSWWENATDYQFKTVLSINWVSLLNEVVKARVIKWQGIQQTRGWTDAEFERRLNPTYFAAYKTSLRLIEDEAILQEVGIFEPPRHKFLPSDLDDLTQWLSLHHKIFVGLALDDYFLLNPEAKYRQRPFLPSLLSGLLKGLPNGSALLAKTLMPHYEKVYQQLMDAEPAWAADLNIELATVLLSLEQAQAAEKVLEKAFESLWLLSAKSPDAPRSPEQWIAAATDAITKDDFDWLSMVYEKVEKMPMVRFKNLLPSIRQLRIEAANLKVLFQAEALQKAEAAQQAKEARDAEERAQAAKKRQAEAESIRKEYEPEMILVEGGTFQMGRQVTLTTFSIGKYPITQAQWKKVMGSNPSHFKGDDLPVECVSWDDAQQFINKLNSMTDKTYSLPTEAQWEFAARGGNKSKGFEYIGSNNVNEVAWYDDNSSSQTHPVGQKTANELGIHDMSGNVWEWCTDWYGDYSSAAVMNPTGAITGSDRVLRGGSWFNIAMYCRVADRYDNTPSNRYYYYGFRVVSFP